MTHPPIRVLLIEDDPMVQEVNRQFVERVEGYRIVGVAGDGVEGVALLNKLQPELVILDVYMPQQDGMETIRLIRQEGHPADVIVITAASDANIIRSMLQNGAIDYIIKPFIFERVKQALDNYRTLRLGLDKGVTLSQAELDELLGVGGKLESGADGGLEPLPKGLQVLTLKQVLLFLMNESQPRSAEEVAEGVGLARVTVRRYLDFLEKAGKVRLDIEYGGVGRPANRYALIRAL